MTFEQYISFTWIWIAIGVAVYILLHFITAPYGRHTKSTWGPLIDNKLGWFIMEIFVLLVLGYYIYYGTNIQSTVNWIIIGLFGFHYINRSIIFPLRIKTNGKKMPISIMMMAMFFNLINGYLIGYYLGEFKVYELSWLSTPQFIIGTAIFL